MTKQFWREWVLYPNTRKGCMLPLSQIETITRAPDAGYASVYMFDGEAAQTIKDSKSSAGLDRFPVYASELVIDLDDGARQLVKAEAELLTLGLGYAVWFSGGKGYHLVIKLADQVCGINVPYSQRKWVESLDIGADLSLYQSGRILSLPGRKHPKTGVRKHLLREVPGKLLALPMLEMPSFLFDFKGEKDGELDSALWRVIGLIQNPPEPGNRHTKIWSTALSLAEVGLSYDTALDLLQETNKKWECSKDAEDVEKAVRQAFKKG